MKLPEILEKFITANGYNAATIADKSGVGIDELNLILEDKLTPTSQTVMKLCRVLNISAEMIIDGNESTMPEVITQSTRVSTDTNYHQEWLTPKKTMRSMEPVMISLSLGDQTNLSASEGEEFVYITKGEVTLFVGDKELQLSCGDSTYYDSIIPHYFRSNSDKSEILIVKQSSI